MMAIPAPNLPPGTFADAPSFLSPREWGIAAHPSNGTAHNTIINATQDLHWAQPRGRGLQIHVIFRTLGQAYGCPTDFPMGSDKSSANGSPLPTPLTDPLPQADSPLAQTRSLKRLNMAHNPQHPTAACAMLPRPGARLKESLARVEPCARKNRPSTRNRNTGKQVTLWGRTVRCARAVHALCARCAKSWPFSTTGSSVSSEDWKDVIEWLLQWTGL